MKFNFSISNPVHIIAFLFSTTGMIMIFLGTTPDLIGMDAGDGIFLILLGSLSIVISYLILIGAVTGSALSKGFRPTS